MFSPGQARARRSERRSATAADGVDSLFEGAPLSVMTGGCVRIIQTTTRAADRNASDGRRPQQSRALLLAADAARSPLCVVLPLRMQPRGRADAASSPLRDGGELDTLRALELRGHGLRQREAPLPGPGRRPCAAPVGSADGAARHEHGRAAPPFAGVTADGIRGACARGAGTGSRRVPCQCDGTRRAC